jgi:adenylate kinase family enzyme
VVVGGPGSGKTNLARRLATQLSVRHVELDELWWGPQWTSCDPAHFEERLRELAEGEAWVADGNYFDVGAVAVLWPAADTLVWLDLPRHVAVARVLRRTTLRVARRRTLWAGNRQTVRDLTPRSILRLVRNWPGYSQRVSVLVSTLDTTQEVIRVRARHDLSALLTRTANAAG